MPPLVIALGAGALVAAILLTWLFWRTDAGED